MVSSINDFKCPFFIGIAGAGMSAIAQYLQGMDKQVSGSDRFFSEGTENEIAGKLLHMGIKCYPQDGSGITADVDVIVASTAIEDTVIEMQIARRRGIPVIRRSELLAIIAKSKKTIAIGGTSGKSTTTAMLFAILEHAGMAPSIISGAGLVSLIKKGLIGNAQVGTGDWLVIEADESDGSIVQYKPEIGVLLNIDKDHQELSELEEVFRVFKENSSQFMVNTTHELSAKLSAGGPDFGVNNSNVAYNATNYKQHGWESAFLINNVLFSLMMAGEYNMENVLAAAAVAAHIGVPLNIAARSLANYQGIYRRQQLIGRKRNIWVIDDYAHNPVKCAAAIKACQPVAPKVIAWFQPHGYGPTRFLRNDFVKEIGAALRKTDEIWMSEIFYAGGSAKKDISANDLIIDMQQQGVQAFFVENRNDFAAAIQPHLTADCVILLMGARDPSLDSFAEKFFEAL